MKKLKVYSIVVTVVLAFLIVGICAYIFVFRGNITEEEAKNIALKYANVIESDVNFVSINKDIGDREYEIHFYDSTYEYEIDVNYINGTVRNFEKDIRDNVNINNNNNSNYSNNNNNNYNNVNSMTEEEAKSIALQRVGKSGNEVTFTRVKKDRENGVTVYDIYFYDSEKEYELSIDVNTKEVVVYKEDYLRVNNSSGNNIITNDGYIGVERAREIVAQHAGLNINDITFSKVELDVDYNIATYEIEFYYNYSEYDYEIDAVTGEILKYEIGR